MLLNAVFPVFPSLCGKVWKYFHDGNKSNDLSIDDVTEILHVWRDRSFRCRKHCAFKVSVIESIWNGRVCLFAINHRNPRTQSRNFALKLSLNETTDGRWCTSRRVKTRFLHCHWISSLQTFSHLFVFFIIFSKQKTPALLLWMRKVSSRKH